ncbi:hypothetical protein B0T16DRAFT_461577 [Cercophora newfieldiana]|uniref:Uncharacterized protein n=1 Tax=Cercophora newfieldiana TaxID=92897 RepID=A0AA39XWF7_9PEZI|nr:hypothetical protein B0T16DRAFT_461577 [Cercophora newfieldiana]
MPSPSAPAPAKEQPNPLRSVLETKGVKFHLKTGGAMWECTVIDRATHERQKAARTDSSASVSSADSETSSTISK